MKNISYTLFSLLVLLYAQTTKAQEWSLDGDNTSGEYIGTKNTQPFPIHTDDVERMRIDEYGNVGIGTTGPSQLLHLNKNSASSVIQMFTNTNNTTGFTLGIDAGGNANFSTPTNFNFILGNLHIMELLGSNRYVGMGWCSNFNPQSQLHLWNDVNKMYVQIASVDCGPSATDGFKIGVNDDAIYGSEPVAELRQQEDAHMVFLTNNTEQVRIQNDGEVEIHVVSNDDALTRILMTDNSNNGLIKYRNISSLPFVSTCATTTQDYLSRWCSTTNQLRNSIIYDNGTRAGINTTSPDAKFDVVNNLGVPAIRGISTVAGFFGGIGITGSSYTTGSLFNIGVNGGQNATGNYFNMGVAGGAGGNNLLNFGGYFITNPECTNNYYRSRLNIGVYGRGTGYQTSDDVCAPGIAGYFQGDLQYTGTLIPPSDQKLKDSIQVISNALTTISKLRPKSYVFNNDSFPYMQLPYGKSYGFIAQQVDTVLPELVHTTMQPQIRDTAGNLLMDTMSFKGLDYTSLIPIAIRGIQELDSLKVGTNATAADSNHVVKWNTTDKTLVNSQIYDNGTHIGIPVTDANSYVNVVNHDRDIAVNVESDYDETSEVIKATYNTDTNPNEVVAVYGYSKYVNGSSQDDGIGGKFTGGKAGVHAIADGDNSIQIGVGGESMNSTSMNVGVLGKAVRYTPSVNVGFSSYVDSADLYNAAFTGESNYINSTSTNAGIICSAQGSSDQNIGGAFQALDSVGSRTGVYAEAHSLAMGPVAYAGYFDGNIHATGTVTWTSDAQLKHNINPLRPETALEAILQLQPKTYEYRTADFPHLGLAQGNQYGLLAQEVEQVLPALVKAERHPEIRNIKGEVTSPAYDYKGLNYVGLIPVLIGAVKEQQHKIDSLQEVITNRLTQLEERMNGCCGTGESNKRDENETPANATTAAHQLSVELSSCR